ncbi:ATP-binding cassette domain-containing protein, partial [Rhodococcus sp. IEGM 1307]|uniref:ATP-binding cassette domain-containing protein n=1 Tax=Rhodococcus sp. IEGM 1307 TaxID=3047091 RepID=UPI0024B82D63
GETIALLARLRGGLAEQRRGEIIDRFALVPRKKARSYSTGNRQKVALVSALSSHARVMLIDEPTSGLD